MLGVLGVLRVLRRILMGHGGTHPLMSRWWSLLHSLVHGLHGVHSLVHGLHSLVHGLHSLVHAWHVGVEGGFPLPS